MGKRAGIYGRQSMSKTKSITEQTAECTADVAARGWTVAQEYSDGVSASRFGKKNRDDWARLLGDLAAGNLDVLVLWESSRGDRTLTSWSAMLDLCRERGVLIHVVTHGRTYDMTNPRDWRSMAEDGVDNAYESEKTSLRGRRAAAAQAAAGRPHGRIAYGYERVYDPHTRELIEQRPHPDRAPIVAELYRRVAAGEPVKRVTDDLNERGIPSPTGIKWNRRTVLLILQRREYLGQRQHRGEVHAGTWPPLVSEADWLAVQRVLSDPARRATRPTRQRWLLSYLATCQVCGGGLHAIPARPGRGYGSAYACERGCVSILAEGEDALDELVSELVLRWLISDPDLRPPADDTAALAARAEAEQIQTRLDEWRDSAARGETSPASLARIEPQLLADLAAAHQRARAAGKPRVLLQLLALGGQEDLVRAAWKDLPVTGKREVIDAVLTVKIARASRRLAPGERLDVERVVVKWRDEL